MSSLLQFLITGGDNSSDCTTSYYAEYDPFDYLYSCGTQYSDPVYEAVNKTDRTPMSPNSSKFNLFIFLKISQFFNSKISSIIWMEFIKFNTYNNINYNSSSNSIIIIIIR